MTGQIEGDALRSLLATAPPEFVAARNTLAKSLRADGNRGTAQTVTALRKPSWVDWALNSIADDHAELVAGYTDAAASSRQAQADAVERREGVDLRAAIRELRDAISALTAPVNGALRNAGRGDDTPAVVARLSEVAADEAMVTALASGVLGAEHLADVPAPTKATGTKRATTSAAKSKTATSKPADKAVSLDVARRKKELQRRRDTAVDELETVTEVMRAAEEAESVAEDELERAEEAVAMAKKALNEAKRERISAGKALPRAQRAADAASKALDSASRSS